MSTTLYHVLDYVGREWSFAHGEWGNEELMETYSSLSELDKRCGPLADAVGEAVDPDDPNPVPARKAGPQPDEDGIWRGIGGLAVQGGTYPNGVPCVMGQWGNTGFGYTTDPMRQAAAAILAACDQADAMAAKEGTDG